MQPKKTRGYTNHLSSLLFSFPELNWENQEKMVLSICCYR